MSIAHTFSERATCSRARVGAVFVQENRIVSTGYNGSPAGMPHCLDVGCETGPDGGCIRSIHAEANAIAFAAKAGISLAGSTLFVTRSPCRRCAQLLINVGVKIVVFDIAYRDQSGLDLLREANIIVHEHETFVDYED